MARPIKPTPVLTKSEADDFFRRAENMRNQPLKVKSLPSLDKAKSVIFKDNAVPVQS